MLKEYVITLPKPGKDPITPANFKPILLLNSDIKMYAKRLTDIIPSLIQKGQMGLIKGRQTSDATRRILNTVHYAEHSQTRSQLLLIDTEKAFLSILSSYVILSFIFLVI